MSFSPCFLSVCIEVSYFSAIQRNICMHSSLISSFVNNDSPERYWHTSSMMHVQYLPSKKSWVYIPNPSRYITWSIFWCFQLDKVWYAVISFCILWAWDILKKRIDQSLNRIFPYTLFMVFPLWINWKLHNQYSWTYLSKMAGISESIESTHQISWGVLCLNVFIEIFDKILFWKVYFWWFLCKILVLSVCV